MIDYNEILTYDEKVKFIQDKIENEKTKLAKIFSDDSEQINTLEILEEYYNLLQEMNKKYGDI